METWTVLMVLGISTMVKIMWMVNKLKIANENLKSALSIF